MFLKKSKYGGMVKWYFLDGPIVEIQPIISLRETRHHLFYHQKLSMLDPFFPGSKNLFQSTPENVMASALNTSFDDMFSGLVTFTTSLPQMQEHFFHRSSLIIPRKLANYLRTFNPLQQPRLRSLSTVLAI